MANGLTARAGRGGRRSDRPIDLSTVQLPSKTRRFLIEFRQLSRVRSTESSGFMERAMGIEPTSEAWEASILPLYDARSAALNFKHTGGTGTSASFTKRGLPIYAAETPLELENKSRAGTAG